MNWKAWLLRQPFGKAFVRHRLRRALAYAVPDTSIRASRVHSRHIFVALAADYGNLGDIAITKAQVEFLRKRFPDDIVEPVPISGTLEAITRLRDCIGDTDIITLIGGGNTGDMYDDIQYLRELWVASFPGHQIVSFPQTVEFSATHHGRRAARRARAAYSAHNGLALLARDRRSQVEIEREFPGVWVTCAPDVVVTHQRAPSHAHRHGVLAALRRDPERSLDDASESVLVEALTQVGPVRFRDTHLGDVRLAPHEADAALDDIWSDFERARLVVTDRLHGMIFAVITGTPCLAFDSGTGKVGQFYRDWLLELPGVELLTADASPEHLIEEARRLASTAPSAASALDDLRYRFGLAFEQACQRD